VLPQKEVFLPFPFPQPFIPSLALSSTYAHTFVGTRRKAGVDGWSQHALSQYNSLYFDLSSGAGAGYRGLSLHENAARTRNRKETGSK